LEENKKTSLNQALPNLRTEAKKEKKILKKKKVFGGCLMCSLMEK